MKCGEEGIITAVKCRESIRHRLIEMGMLPGTKVRVMRCAPLGDPVKYQLRGYCLSIRKEDTKDIHVKPFPSRKLVPISMLSAGEKVKVETIEADQPNRKLIESHGIHVGTTIKVVKISKDLITLSVSGKSIGLAKAVCAKIFVVRS